MKKIYTILILLSLTSCVSLRNLISRDDPYKNRVVKKQEKTTEVIKEKALNTYDKVIEKTYDAVNGVKETVKEKEVIKEEKKVEKIEKLELDKVEFTDIEKQILEKFKTEYNLIESKEDIVRKTRETIITLNKKENQKIDKIKFLAKLNEVLVTTKTRSYTLALSRVMNNW